MRDTGWVSDPATIPVTLSNGNSTPPPNNNTFTPTQGDWTGSGPIIVAATGDGASGEPDATSVTNRIAGWNADLMLYLGDVYESGTRWSSTTGTAARALTTDASNRSRTRPSAITNTSAPPRPATRTTGTTCRTTTATPSGPGISSASTRPGPASSIRRWPGRPGQLVGRRPGGEYLNLHAGLLPPPRIQHRPRRRTA